MGCGRGRGKRVIPWSSLPPVVLKFNVDGDSRGKLGPAGISGVLHNSKGEVLLMFSKPIGIRDSNEVEVLAISEALCIFSGSFQDKLIVESNSSNVVGWVPQIGSKPWKFHFYFNEI